MIVLTNIAKPVLLRLKLPYLRKLTIRLFQNDHVPDGIDDAAAYQEADFPGYLPQSLSDLGLSYLNAAGQGQSDTCTHTWSMNAAAPSNDIYGYYVTDANGFLIFADRRGVDPVAMNRAGATYTLRINFLEDTLRM